ncbi:MAG: hypothetical protein ACRDTD_14145 [Pseudonocardiaceae bacterium]
MNDQVDRQLAAALRAQALGLGAGSPIPSRRHVARSRTGLPAWAVLALAVLLGAVAGAVAGVVSVW